MIVGIVSAITAALLINYFFVDPVHTLNVADGDQAVALVVFVTVAALVSGAVELAVRRARAAERAQREAETMSALAGPEPRRRGVAAGNSPAGARDFGMESVTLKARVRGVGDWVDVEHVGWAPEGSEAQLRFDVAAGPHLRMVGRGPALFAEDRRVLEAFASAARTAYEGMELSGRRRRPDPGDVDRQRTALLAAVGHDLRTPLAGDQGGGREHCARTTSSGRSRSERSCWRRSRSPPTASTPSSATCSTPAGSRPGR